MTGIPEGIVTIALDAMGGDHGPSITVPAALQAIGNGGIAVALVGDPVAIQAELDRYDTPAKQYDLAKLTTPDIVAMALAALGVDAAEQIVRA